MWRVFAQLLKLNVFLHETLNSSDVYLPVRLSVCTRRLTTLMSICLSVCPCAQDAKQLCCLYLHVCLSLSRPLWTLYSSSMYLPPRRTDQWNNRLTDRQEMYQFHSISCPNLILNFINFARKNWRNSFQWRLQKIKRISFSWSHLEVFLKKVKLLNELNVRLQFKSNLTVLTLFKAN